MKALAAAAPSKNTGIGSNVSVKGGGFVVEAIAAINPISNGAAANTAKMIRTARTR